MKSFLRWVGGKKQLLEKILPLCPKKYNVYHEPFIGGGALFFALEPTLAYINDANHRLVNAYKYVKHHPNDLVGSSWHIECTEKDYYEQRNLLNQEDVNKLDIDCARRFIYVNKKCFNGLWRENRKGNFNVPFCKNDKEVFTEKYVETIHQCSSALKRTKISQGDYSETLKNMNEGDFAYFDPPYDSYDESKKNFVGYTSQGFDREKQTKLRDDVLALKRRGVHVMLSNANTEFIRNLYKDDFDLHEVNARRNINSDGKKRGNVGELIIV
jgi:DNA adenine methylase